MLHFARFEMMEFSTSLSSGHVAIINTHIHKRHQREEQWGFSHSLIIICNVEMCIQTALEQNFPTVTTCIYSSSCFLQKQRFSVSRVATQAPKFIYLFICLFLCLFVFQILWIFWASGPWRRPNKQILANVNAPLVLRSQFVSLNAPLDINNAGQLVGNVRGAKGSKDRVGTAMRRCWAGNQGC